jgi:Domain of unknown function (DUF3402)
MKVITSIYLNCRPDLRDEWLTGTEVEDVQGALVSFCLDLVHMLIYSSMLLRHKKLRCEH